MKKRGITLIEVIISMALISVLLIPASQIVIMTNKNNRQSQIKQESNDIGQNILESIRNIEEVKETDSHNLQIKTGNSKDYTELVLKEQNQNETKYVTTIVDKNNKSEDLEITKQIKDGEIHYTYNVPFANYKKNYKVDIQVSKEVQYETTKPSIKYDKKQTYIPEVGTDTDPDKISDKCKNDYDLILKFTNDYYVLNGFDDNIWNYDKTNKLALLINKDNSNNIYAQLYRNKGNEENVKLDKMIYEKQLFNMNQLENKYKDNVKILLYLTNNNSKNESDPYQLKQSLIVQSNIDTDGNKAFGDFSSDVQIDVLNGKNSSGYMDVLFDDKNGYIYNVNNFTYYDQTASSRNGNLYSFKVSVLLDDDTQFYGNTTGIIGD